MTTPPRVASTQATHEGVDSLAGTHVRARTRRDRPREDPLVEAEATELLPGGTGPDRGTPVSDRQLDQRDRQQSAKRKKPGPEPSGTPPAIPVAAPPSDAPPTDPE